MKSTIIFVLLFTIISCQNSFSQKRTFVNYDLFNSLILKPRVGIERISGKNSVGMNLVFRWWDIGNSCDRVLPIKKNSYGTNLFYRRSISEDSNTYLESLIDFKYHRNKDYRSCVEGYSYSGVRKEITYKLGFKIGQRLNFKARKNYIDISAGLGFGFRNIWDDVQKAASGFDNGLSPEENFISIKRLVENMNGNFEGVFTPYLSVNMNHLISIKDKKR